jgi:hypothetical protein
MEKRIAQETTPVVATVAGDTVSWIKRVADKRVSMKVVVIAIVAAFIVGRIIVAFIS